MFLKFAWTFLIVSILYVSELMNGFAWTKLAVAAFNMATQ